MSAIEDSRLNYDNGCLISFSNDEAGEGVMSTVYFIYLLIFLAVEVYFRADINRPVILSVGVGGDRRMSNSWIVGTLSAIEMLREPSVHVHSEL